MKYRYKVMADVLMVHLPLPGGGWRTRFFLTFGRGRLSLVVSK